ncbi:MAG: helix-turn-helix domain-containing protein, partial [Candidatus Microbacterium stercoravium]
LIGSDIVYISIYDEASRVNAVRASAGTISEDFGVLSVPFGIGVGGIIAATLKPFISTDYLSDPAISHLDVVDEGMGNEGIRAVAAVPMVVRGRVLGGLYAADRTPREYSADEVEVLETFAALSAVAIENARLFEENAAALDRVSEAYRSLSARNEGAEEAEDQHVRIIALGLEVESEEEAVTALAAILQMPLLVVDEFGFTIASSTGAELPSDEETHAALVRAQLAAERTGGAEEFAFDGEDRGVCMPMRAGGSYLGALIARTPEGLRGDRARVFESAAQLMSTVMLTRRVHVDASANRRSEELRTALEPTAVATARTCIDFADGPSLNRVAVFLMTPTARPDGWCEGVSRLTVTAGGAVCEQRDGSLIGVLSPHDLPRLARLPEEFFSQGTSPAVVVPDVAARDAGVAARHLTEYVRSNEVPVGGTYYELTLPELSGLLLPLSSDAVRLSAFTSTILGGLGNEESAERLRETLRSYLDHGRNARRASEALHIHYKTVQQRLERAAHLLDLDWDDADAVLRVHLALRLVQPESRSPGTGVPPA